MDADKPISSRKISELTSADNPKANKEGSRLDIKNRPIMGKVGATDEPKENLDKPPVDPLTDDSSDDDSAGNKGASTSGETKIPSISKPAADKEPAKEPPANNNSPASGDKYAAPESSDKTAALTDKEAKLSAEDTERMNQVQEYIKSGTYNVPINSVAHKRSINVSVGLTVVVLILSLFLIDILLDSGDILLVQKLPHTHFFSAKNSN